MCMQEYMAVRNAISKVCSGLLFLSRDYVDLNKANMEVAEQRGTDENENSSDRADVHHEACKAGDDFWDTPASPGCPASLASSTMEQHIQIDSKLRLQSISCHMMLPDVPRDLRQPFRRINGQTINLTRAMILMTMTTFQTKLGWRYEKERHTQILLTLS
jgi:hypothetical protein